MGLEPCTKALTPLLIEPKDERRPMKAHSSPKADLKAVFAALSEMQAPKRQAPEMQDEDQDHPLNIEDDPEGNPELCEANSSSAYRGLWEQRGFAQALLAAARAQQEAIAAAFVAALCEGKITLFRMMLDLEREAAAFEHEQQEQQGSTLADYLLPLLRRDLVSQREAEREAAQTERPWEVAATRPANEPEASQARTTGHATQKARPSPAQGAVAAIEAEGVDASSADRDGSLKIKASHGKQCKNLSFSRRGLGRALRCSVDPSSPGKDGRSELFRPRRAADGGTRDAEDCSRRGCSRDGHYRGRAPSASHLRRVSKAQALDCG